MIRHAVRVLLVSADERVLLLAAEDPDDGGSRFWFPPGGGLEAGEDARAAATREVLEETGFALQDVGVEVWRRRHVFTWRGEEIDQRERWFLARVQRAFAVERSGWTAGEREDLRDARWWSLAQLDAATDRLVPGDLAARLRSALRLREHEEILTGGNVTPVVRVGDAVHRRAGPWSAAVQRLLAHLEAAGFDRAPRPRGFDADGREVVTFLPGETYNYPLPALLWSDALLVQAAELLRDLHAATAGFAPQPGDRWQVAAPADLPHEVFCHNDVAPYNVVLRDGRIAGLIDFDTAGPGPRIWDVVHAAYRFVPLSVTEGPAALHDIREQARRTRLFADTYTLSDTERRRFVPTLLARLDALRHTTTSDAHVYERDAAHVAAHRAAFDAALS